MHYYYLLSVDWRATETSVSSAAAAALATVSDNRYTATLPISSRHTQ